MIAVTNNLCSGRNKANHLEREIACNEKQRKIPHHDTWALATLYENEDESSKKRQKPRRTFKQEHSVNSKA
jgi:hypothetical protein